MDKIRRQLIRSELNAQLEGIFLHKKKVKELSLIEAWHSVLLSCPCEDLVICYVEGSLIFSFCKDKYPDSPIEQNACIQEHMEMVLELMDDISPLSIVKSGYEHMAISDKLKVKGRTFLEAGLKMWLLKNIGKEVSIPLKDLPTELQTYNNYQLYPRAFSA